MSPKCPYLLTKDFRSDYLSSIYETATKMAWNGFEWGRRVVSPTVNGVTSGSYLDWDGIFCFNWVYLHMDAVSRRLINFTYLFYPLSLQFKECQRSFMHLDLTLTTFSTRKRETRNEFDAKTTFILIINSVFPNYERIPFKNAELFNGFFFGFHSF